VQIQYTRKFLQLSLNYTKLLILNCYRLRLATLLNCWLI